MNKRQRKIEALDFIYLILIGMRGSADTFMDRGQDEEMKMWDAVEDIAISLKIRADKLKSKQEDKDDDKLYRKGNPMQYE